MNTMHDTIKIKYAKLGYLPDYPPHLISDEEMFDAFLPFTKVETAYDDATSSELSYFTSHYQCTQPELLPKYKTLVNSIAYHINEVKTNARDNTALPDWVYSYMLGEVLSPVTSSYNDVVDLASMLEIDDKFDEYDDKMYVAIYQVSSLWLSRYPKETLDHRPPTMFAEPHIIKALRLAQADERYANQIQIALRRGGI